MGPRQIDEAHRSSTPLELLFDLTFVVAIAQLAGRLAHATLDGHLSSAIGPFLMVFFAIWWAWMTFTWFASAYDTDDVSYRLAAFVQMGDVLVLAAGTGRAFDHGDFAVVTIGYLIMRLGLLSMWLRSAVQHPSGRSTSLRYVGGIACLQVLWLVRLGVADRVGLATFMLLAALELLVPVWAERAGGSTSWHPHHIAERYSLFTIILLGEGVLAATTGVIGVVEDAAGPSLAIMSASSLVIVLSLWWLYFAVPAGEPLAARRHRSFLWGYGHYVPFAALAALGAGLGGGSCGQHRSCGGSVGSNRHSHGGGSSRLGDRVGRAAALQRRTWPVPASRCDHSPAVGASDCCPRFPGYRPDRGRLPGRVGCCGSRRRGFHAPAKAPGCGRERRSTDIGVREQTQGG